MTRIRRDRSSPHYNQFQRYTTKEHRNSILKLRCKSKREVTHEDEWFFTGKDTWDYKFASYDNPILISASLLLIPAETIF